MIDHKHKISTHKNKYLHELTNDLFRINFICSSYLDNYTKEDINKVLVLYGHHPINDDDKQNILNTIKKMRSLK